MGRWKKSKSFIIRNNNLLKNYRQSDRCYKLITIIWREKKIARNVATGNGSNSRSHFKISKFSVISQRAFFFIQMIKLNGWRLRKFLSGNRWRSLARFFLLAHFFILAIIFFLLFFRKVRSTAWLWPSGFTKRWSWRVTSFTWSLVARLASKTQGM